MNFPGICRTIGGSSGGSSNLRLPDVAHRLAIGSQRLDQAVVLGTRVENG
jgi:hypothetical protein